MSRTATVRIAPVEFSRKIGAIPPDARGDVVRVKGVIFRSGIYPIQAYEMNPDDMRAAVADFSPVPLDLGHPSAPSPMDGHLGQLESVELSEDGTTMFGVAAIPRFVMEKMGAAKLKVSASFDRATKRLRSLSLVTRPQIEDAELYAAFCACQEAASTVTPAKGTTMPDDELTDDERRLLEGFRNTPTDERAGVLAVLEGTYVEPKDEDEDEDEGVEEAESAPIPPEVAAFAAKIAELEAKDRRRDAEVFVDAAIKDDLVLPAEKADLVAEFAQLALDDERTPAQFSNGKTWSRVARRQAEIRSRKAHGWGQDRIAGSADFGRHTLSNGPAGETEESRNARLKADLQATVSGRAALAAGVLN
jgi:hypothetical protein